MICRVLATFNTNSLIGFNDIQKLGSLQAHMTAGIFFQKLQCAFDNSDRWQYWVSRKMTLEIGQVLREIDLSRQRAFRFLNICKLKMISRIYGHGRTIPSFSGGDNV